MHPRLFRVLVGVLAVLLCSTAILASQTVPASASTGNHATPSQAEAGSMVLALASIVLGALMVLIFRPRAAVATEKA